MNPRLKKEGGGITVPVLVVGFLAAGALVVWYNSTLAPAVTSTLAPSETSTIPIFPAVVSMTPIDTSAIARGNPIVKVKLPAKLSPDAQIGKRIFEAKCSACHGKNAAGRSGIGPPFVHIIYRPAHHGDGAFVAAAKNGVRSHHWTFGDMPPVQGVTDGEVKYVVRYIRELQRANGVN